MKYVLIFLGTVPLAFYSNGQTLPPYTPSEGLVAWYNLNGNELDAGPNALHGVPDGVQPAPDRFGNPGMAVNFPGASSIDLSNSELFMLDTAGTFSAWMNFAADPTYLQSGNPILGRNADNSVYGFSFGPVASSGSFVTTLGLSGSNYLLYETEVDLTGWVHVTSTFSAASDEFTFYVNGVPAFTEPFLAENLIHPVCNTYIGKFRGTAGNCACQYYTGDLDEIGIWNRALTAEEVLILSSGAVAGGCTDADACNFQSEAMMDDGSCTYGCAYCGEGTIWDASQEACVGLALDCGWNPDSDGDFLIGVSDLLALLSVYGDSDQDSDGIMDSLDDCVGVVDPCGVCNGAGTDSDADGICDSSDDCIGQYDECGVCNGEGPNQLVIDSLVYTIDSVYIDLIDSWYTFEYVSDTIWSVTCEWFCGDEIEYHGYDYQTRLFGDQCWFEENLRTESYRNGDSILALGSSSEWGSTTLGAVAVYGEGNAPVQSGSGDEETNLLNYGRLYNGYAVQDSRGICPANWHVSNDSDWLELETGLGISVSEASTQGWRGTDQGTQLKASSLDDPSWNGTNVTGFKALPGGFINYYGNFFYESEFCFFWSIDSNSSSQSSGLSRHLRTSQSGIARASYDQGSLKYGYSIRCVMDTE